MKRINHTIMGYSVLLCALIVIFIPSRFISDGMGRYTYGYPLTSITIYQREPNSIWFGTNFFTGNDGLHINLLSILVNVLIIYLAIHFVTKRWKRRKETITLKRQQGAS
ncbi:hypothetical protein [Halalkalibacter hemicellulosilyticus]|uniref:Uncharacterized protein n=1 Tax=Halalkalibacter hemicellulosilyticusJCM 9152 TaxID=1236971 RepID=W4QDL4_9BACI|nr:hypothetical protein [Halalkalibacter hemicellulosilyticus]GAE29429.1 hypothetical protein JCM9152_786 [Halalkalibacter hemicellulosilyticusJCM 9152]